MKKKLILIILIVLLVGGGAGGFFWWKAQHSSKSKTTKKTATPAIWNTYSTDQHHLHTLKDFLISAGGGNFVVKMTVTLDFKDDTSYMKFLGSKTLDEGKKAIAASTKSEGGSSSAALTPEEVAINDAIGELMMKASDAQIHDKNALKQYLLNNLYIQLHLNENQLKDLYIENYVVQ